MNPAYLLDTDILIELLRGRGRPAAARFRESEGRIAVSTVSVMELEYGVERSRDRERNRIAVNSLLSRLDVLAFDAAAAENAGRLRSELAAAGMPMGPYDVLIAGHARSRGLSVLTHNLRQFGRVPGLRAEDWLGG
jgi:tRNA(fMet)-specific endonuclease VapC